MNAPRATAAADLAADLMADLSALPMPHDSTGDRTLVHAAVHRPPPRGRALQLVVRVESLGWRRLSLRVDRNSVGMRVGVMYIEAGLRTS